MKITKIILKSNSEISLGNLTVLVGPNNVGKSQTLRDIHEKLNKGEQAKTTLIDKIEFQDITYEQFTEHVAIGDHPTQDKLVQIKGIDSTLLKPHERDIMPTELKEQFQTKPNWDYLLARDVGRFLNALLNAETRLQISTKKPSKKRKDTTQNLLQILYEKPKEYEEKLLNSFKDTFGKELKLQMDGPELVFRVGDKFENIPPSEKDASPILEEFPTLDIQGDGFRSFVSILLGLLLTENRIILIDEPEAFLHPAQARFLGSKIKDFSNNPNVQIIISTHSADILDGILSSSKNDKSQETNESTKNITIFRMNRTGNDTKFSEISPQIISKLASSPLLSSQSIHESIFYEGVVICEGDSDRCIYETVYSKMFNDKRMLFVHTFGKQNIEKVVSILKDATIPVCVVTDIDILNSKDIFQKLLCSLKNESHEQLIQTRQEISDYINKTDENCILMTLKKETKEFLKELESENILDLPNARSALERIKNNSNKWHDIKQKGVSSLPTNLKDKSRNVLKAAKDLGLFIVPVGELEQWLDIGVRKQDWTSKVLEKWKLDDPPEDLKNFVKEFKNFLFDENITS